MKKSITRALARLAKDGDVEAVAEFMRQNGLEDVTRYPMTFGVLGLFIGKKRV